MVVLSEVVRNTLHLPYQKGYRATQGTFTSCTTLKMVPDISVAAFLRSNVAG